MRKNQRHRRLQARTNRLSIRRWRLAGPFLETQGLEDHRRFFARSVKYLIPVKNWGDELIPWQQANHENLIQMLSAFAAQTPLRMKDTRNADVVIERSVTMPLLGKHHCRLRDSSKHINRLAGEMILLIKRSFPSRFPGHRRERARMMSAFTKLLKKKFIGGVENPELDPRWE